MRQRKGNARASGDAAQADAAHTKGSTEPMVGWSSLALASLVGLLLAVATLVPLVVLCRSDRAHLLAQLAGARFVRDRDCSAVRDDQRQDCQDFVECYHKTNLSPTHANADSIVVEKDLHIFYDAFFCDQEFIAVANTWLPVNPRMMKLMTKRQVSHPISAAMASLARRYRPAGLQWQKHETVNTIEHKPWSA